MPPPDLHVLRLVPNACQSVVQPAATPPLQELEGVLAQAEGVPKASELLQFFVDDYIMPMVFQR